MEMPCSFSFEAKYSSKNSFTGADVSLFDLPSPRRESASSLPRFASSSRLLLSTRGEAGRAMHCMVHSDRSAQDSTSDLVVIVLAVFSISVESAGPSGGCALYIVAWPPNNT